MKVNYLLLFVMKSESVGTVAIPPFITAAAGRHYTPPNYSDFSAMEVFVRMEVEKHPYHVVLQSKQPRKEVIKSI